MQGILLIVVLLVAAAALLAWKLALAIIRQYGVFLIWWFITGHHFGGDRECCRDHCPPRVRWRRARRRLLPFVALVAFAVALSERIPWQLAIPAGLLAAVMVLYPHRTHRVARVVASPVAQRLPALPLPALPSQVSDRATALAELVQHQRRTVEPFARALAVPTGESAAILSKTLLIPRKISQDSQVIAPLPAHFQHDPKQLAVIENIAGHRFGHEWTARTPVRLPSGTRAKPVQGRRSSAYPGPWLVLSRKPYPPEYLAFAEVTDLIAARGGPEKILAGLTTGREPVWLNFESALAHLALSVGTGGGKSSFLRFLVAQFSYWGAADFPVIDTALSSLKGMEAVPGLRIYKKSQEQWDALAGLTRRMDTRLEELDAGREKFPLCVLFLEEQNDAAIRWRMHWKDHPDRGKGSPATPPVYDHTTQLVVGARKVGYRVVGVYQRMNAASCGGLDAGVYRDQFPTKMLSRFGPNAVKTLTGLTPRQVDTSEINGRFAFITGDRVRYVQAPYGTAAELSAFALSGKAGDVPSDMSPEPVRAIEAGQEVRGQGTGDRVLTLVTSRRTLREHAERGTVPLGYEALKKRRQRGGFPEGVDGTYTDEELREWFGERVTTPLAQP